MLFKDVIIEKHIDRPIEIPSFFIKGKIQIDCEYFIDKIPNTAATNTNKSVYEQDKIRAKYCNIRLFFNPLNDYRIVTDVLGTLNTDSIR